MLREVVRGHLKRGLTEKPQHQNERRPPIARAGILILPINHKEVMMTYYKGSAARKELPDTIEERLAQVLKTDLAPQKQRILRYLATNPRAFTHDLARNCAVGYPPNRIMELNREDLPQWGIRIQCISPPKGQMNRFGDPTYVHRWQLVMLPRSKLV